jgi:hypothetical protein
MVLTLSRQFVTLTGTGKAVRVFLVLEFKSSNVEELYAQYPSPNIFRVIKSRRMRWAKHVAGTRTVDVHTGVWW